VNLHVELSQFAFPRAFPLVYNYNNSLATTTLLLFGVSVCVCVCVSAFAFYGNRRFVYCQYLSHPLSPSPSLRPFPSQNVYIRLSVNCSCSCCCCCFCCCCVQCSFLAHKIDMLAAPFFSRSSTHTQIDAALLSRSHIHAHRFEFEQQAFTDTQHTEA